jgi:uncharacterized protein YqjF (DUF2071 family)
MFADRGMTDARPFLTADWRHLAILNYDVPRELLLPLVPTGTELDDFNGATLASLVGFRFLDTRILGLAVPGHRDFDEVNLRFYVRRRHDDGEWRRAVVFVRELVPRRMIALVARRWYNEPYSAVPMAHDLSLDGTADGRPGRATYRWRLGAREHRLEVRIRGLPRLPEPGSEAEFVAEHYWGYTRQRDGGTMEYRVDHPKWRVWSAERAELDCDVALVYGPGFAPCLTASPCSAFLAEGSAVSVSQGRRLPRSEFSS